MGEPVDVNLSEPIEQQVAAPIRGWFRPGDRRINREGRPNGSKSARLASKSVILAPHADRLKHFVVPLRELEWRLTRPNGFWLVNLPPAWEIVDSRVDASAGPVFVHRSQRFPDRMWLS